MTVELVAFRADHYWAIQRPREGCDEGLLTAQQHETAGPAYTLLVDRQVVACLGLHVSLGYVWALVDELAAEHPFTLHRAVLRLIRAAETFGWRTLRAEVRGDFALGRRWLERLGFRADAHDVYVRES